MSSPEMESICIQDMNNFSNTSFAIGGPPMLLAEEPMDLDLSAI